MRYNDWNEFKDYVHSKGVTLKELAAAAHVSYSTLKRKYCNCEIDKEFDMHIQEMLRECVYENNRKTA